MSAINFVVRGDAGVSERGAVAGASGSNSIIVGDGQDISLNLQRSHILSYTRQGQALQVTLVNGEVITIEGFFAADGTAENRLFISSSGQLAEVDLISADGNLMLAQYVDADSFGKWSPDDALYFIENGSVEIAGVEPISDVGMLGVPILGGLGGLSSAGLAAAGVAAAVVASGIDGDGDSSGGGTLPDGGDDTDDTDDGDDTDDTDDTDDGDDTDDTDDTDDVVDPPVVTITEGVESVDHVVNDDDHSDGVTVSGTGTPGTSGTITVGDVTHDITVAADGSWSTTYTPDEIPGGEYELDVTVTLTNDGGTTTATDVVVIDTFTEVTFDASGVEGEGVVNFDEESDGVVLTGTTQAGSSVVVSFGGASYDAVVTGSSWSLDVPAGTFAQGEYDLEISVTATDAYGNTASTTDTLHIDTITGVTLDTSAAGGDGTVNEVEHADGVTVNGLAEAGASVVVTLGDYSQTVTASNAGTWTASFSANQVPTGTLDVPVTAVATDAAGNTATASGTVQIDTELDVTVDTASVETDGIVNFVERADGVTLTGTSDAGASVVVEFESGVRTVTADGNGNWSADFAASEIRGGLVEVGAPVTATATDAAGNVAVTNGTVQLDTYVNTLTGVGTVEGDDVVNNAEASDGITLTGTVEQGSTVMVTLDGGGVSTTHQATVQANGTWSVDFAASEIAAGEYTADVSIAATDAAGNTRSISDSFAVDTIAPDAPNVESFTEGEGSGSATSTRGIGIENTTSDVSLFEYANGADAATALSADNGTFVNPGTGELNFFFDDGHEVSNGSHIIVTDGDAAGNSNSTLMVLDEQGNNIVDVPTGALTDHNIGAIDLHFAEDSVLSLTVEDMNAMSANDNILVVHGGSDDTVYFDAVTGAPDGTTTIDGRSYDVYSVGDDGQFIIGEDVNLNPVT